MKQYKITFMVPHETNIDAVSAQDAHNEASRIINSTRVEKGEIKPVLHSITYLGEIQDDFDYPPPAA